MDFWGNIEAYIKDELPEAERQAFDAALTTDATLRQSVDEQRLIINLLRQNRSAIVANEMAADAPKRQRLKGIIDAYVAELPDAPVETLEKAENTEGGKPVPFPLQVVKKNRVVWWAAAASVALVAAAGIWWLQQTPSSPQPIMVQTPTPPPLPVDTLKNVGTPKAENVAVEVKKETPQHTIGKSSEDEFRKLADSKDTSKIIYLATHGFYVASNNNAVLAVLKNDISSEAEQITEPTKGASSNAISKEDQTLLTALEAIAANKPTAAIEVLQGRNDEKARYYRALATLLMDKKKGKQALEALADDTGLEVYFRNKIKEVLKKIN